MALSLLVLGGSGFVGRALVEEGCRRGWDVTTFNRGRGPAIPGISRIVGDRLDPATLRPLGRRDWDVVVVEDDEKHAITGSKDRHTKPDPQT